MCEGSILGGLLGTFDILGWLCLKKALWILHYRIDDGLIIIIIQRNGHKAAYLTISDAHQPYIPTAVTEEFSRNQTKKSGGGF